MPRGPDDHHHLGGDILVRRLEDVHVARPRMARFATHFTAPRIRRRPRWSARSRGSPPRSPEDLPGPADTGFPPTRGIGVRVEARPGHRRLPWIGWARDLTVFVIREPISGDRRDSLSRHPFSHGGGPIREILPWADAHRLRLEPSANSPESLGDGSGTAIAWR
jgi:hypothetical protein